MKYPSSSTLSHLRLLTQQPFQDFSAPLRVFLNRLLYLSVKIKRSVEAFRPGLFCLASGQVTLLFIFFTVILP
jgi:hypothetical protein